MLILILTVATKEEMSQARLPLAYRDSCAHLLIPLNRCRYEEYYLPWKCEVRDILNSLVNWNFFVDMNLIFLLGNYRMRDTLTRNANTSSSRSVLRRWRNWRLRKRPRRVRSRGVSIQMGEGGKGERWKERKGEGERDYGYHLYREEETWYKDIQRQKEQHPVDWLTDWTESIGLFNSSLHHFLFDFIRFSLRYTHHIIPFFKSIHDRCTHHKTWNHCHPWRPEAIRPNRIPSQTDTDIIV